jgi:hypothetical protein
VANVVIELPGGAGVIRSDDERFDYCLTSNVKTGVGQPIAYQDRYEPGRIDLGDERRLVGGLLPAGAVSAEIVDDRGIRVSAVVAGGAYAAVLDASDWRLTPPVCCRDAAGHPVRRPWAADYPSERVADAQEPCPACGSVDWDEYTPFEEWRGGRGSKVDGTSVPNPVVSCRVCGHQEPEGTFFGLASTEPENEDEDERARRIARFHAQHRRRQWLGAEPRLKAASFSIYGLKGRPGRLGGQSWTDSGLTAATVEHYEHPNAGRLSGDRPQVSVTTDSSQYRVDALEQARAALEHLQQATGQSWPDVSHAAKTLWLKARDRERRAMALSRTQSDQVLLIDDEPGTAIMLPGVHGNWVAALDHGDLTIIIAANGLAPESVQLEQTHDPVAQLLGPEPPDP